MTCRKRTLDTLDGISFIHLFSVSVVVGKLIKKFMVTSTYFETINKIMLVSQIFKKLTPVVIFSSKFQIIYFYSVDTLDTRI